MKRLFGRLQLTSLRSNPSNPIQNQSRQSVWSVASSTISFSVTLNLPERPTATVA